MKIFRDITYSFKGRHAVQRVEDYPTALFRRTEQEILDVYHE